MHVGKGICGSIIMSLDIPTGRQPMIHTGGGGGWGGNGAMQLMIYSSCSFIHLPSSFSPTGTHQHVNALQRLSSEKFILRCRGNCTDTVGLVCLPPVLLLHTCACTSILLSLHPPSILSPLTTPSGCLCQCSSRNCLVKRGWRNL